MSFLDCAAFIAGPSDQLGDEILCAYGIATTISQEANYINGGTILMTTRVIQEIYQLTEFLWAAPIPAILMGIGLLLTIAFRGKYIFAVKTLWNNTLGMMFKRNNGEDQGEGTISGFSCGMAAMGCIGIGNIAGVATAITMGGPGAVFWMWFSGLLGASTKAAEIILGQRYRVRYNSNDEFICHTPFILRDAMGCSVGAMILAAFNVLSGPWSNLTQKEALTNSFYVAFGFPKWAIAGVMGITLLGAMLGGLKRISAIADRIVPFMSVFYLISCVGIIAMNWRNIPYAFMSIFRGAFSPVAATGGFAGATIRDAMRYGVARGMYSNDACTGMGIVLHAAAISDHPVRQSCWGWGEILVKTIFVCTLTALTLLTSGAYVEHGGVTSGQLVTMAFTDAYGKVGGYLMAVALGLFGWTVILMVYYSCEKSLDFIIGDKDMHKGLRYIFMAYYLLPLVFTPTVQVDFIWALQDLLSCVFVVTTAAMIINQRKEIIRLFNDFWYRYAPAVKDGEHPKPVVYENSQKR